MGQRDWKFKVLIWFEIRWAMKSLEERLKLCYVWFLRAESTSWVLIIKIHKKLLGFQRIHSRAAPGRLLRILAIGGAGAPRDIRQLCYRRYNWCIIFSLNFNNPASANSQKPASQLRAEPEPAGAAHARHVPTVAQPTQFNNHRSFNNYHWW